MMIASRSSPVLRMTNASLRLGSSQKRRRRMMVVRCLHGFASSGVDDSTTSTGNSSSSPPAPPAVGEAALDADAAAALASATAAAAAKTQPPKVLFPWRHETAENMLPRFVPGTPESLYHQVLAPAGQSFIAYLYLNVPWWQILLGWDWRSELAESSSFALAQGVAGIVSNVYRIPLDTLLTESSDDRPSLDFRYKVPASTPTSGRDGEECPFREKETPPPPSDEASKQASSNRTADSPDRYCPEVDHMLDRPLRQLFQSAHERGRDLLQIRLQTTPSSRCAVVSLFCLPFVTRQAVERDPAILERLGKIVVKASRSDLPGSFQGMYEFVQEQVERHDKLETTIELQVLVECEEVFQVVDRETGVVLQGSPEAAVRKVWHLVCLENTSTVAFSSSFPYLPQTKIGNWIITDIDDLLGPRKWYHGR